MATRVVEPGEIQMGDISTETITPSPEGHDGVTDETSFSNPDGQPETYNTGETSNLGTGFTTPVRPRQETIEPFSGKGKSLSGATVKGAAHNKMIYITSRVGYTTVTKEEINNALLSSRTRRDTTAKGIDNMVDYVFKKDGDFYLCIKGYDAKIRGYRLTYKEKGNEIIKFYAYTRLKSDYGEDIAQLVELLFTDPDKFNEKYKAIDWAQFDQTYQKFVADGERQEEWEEMRHGPQGEPWSQNEPGLQNEPIRQQQQIIDLPELRKLMAKNLNPEQFIKEFIALPQDELIQFGFTPEVVAEAVSGIAVSMDISNIKLELHNEIGELEEAIGEMEEKNINLDISLEAKSNEISVLTLWGASQNRNYPPPLWGASQKW